MDPRQAWQAWLERGPQLYAITDPEVAGKDHVAIVRELLEAGVRLIQLRDKHLPDGPFYEQARVCVEMCRAADAWCLINDRVDVALAAGADGVHLGQDDLPPEVARRILGPARIVGWSASDRTEFQRACEHPDVDYIGFGAVFPTHTKADARHADLDLLRDLLPACSKPVAAIGGITLERLDAVLALPVAMVAVVSDIMRGPVEERARAYLERLQTRRGRN